MKKVINGLGVIILVVVSAIVALNASAEIKFSNVNVYAIRNGTAKIGWDTFSEETKAIIYYGNSADKLDKTLEYGVYSFNHEATLSGLEKDLTYYYKIIAINRAGETNELFLQTFSTKNMTDSLAPDFLVARVLQSTRDAIALSWETNEETRAEIKLGVDTGNLDRSDGDGDFKTKHEKIIGGLDTDQKYYFKIIAEDHDGNTTTEVLQFRTNQYLSEKTELVIDNIKPMDADPTMISARQVNLSWRTNLIAKCKVRYGEKSNEYNKELEANKRERVLDHTLSITELEPVKTYYYKIECYESFYDKRKETTEYTFTTLSPNAPAKKTATVSAPAPSVPAEVRDTDGDTLSDYYEKEIYTDPNKKDTDGDGYNDDLELKNGYDPLVAGSAKLQAVLYFRPKLSQAKESAKGNELKSLVRKKLGAVRVSDKNWQTLIRAYIYGHYPIDAITKAIRLGGVTVHPSIPWETWRNTAGYKNAMGI